MSCHIISYHIISYLYIPNLIHYVILNVIYHAMHHLLYISFFVTWCCVCVISFIVVNSILLFHVVDLHVVFHTVVYNIACKCIMFFFKLLALYFSAL